MNILLTGMTGFLGRNVAVSLFREGHQIYALNRRSLACSPNDRTDYVPILCDLLTGAGISNVPWSQLDVVIHLAASGVKAATRTWSEALAVNVEGTQRLLNFIKTKGSRSPTVFVARTFYEHLARKCPPLLNNPYIASKLTASNLVKLWALEYSGTVILGTFFQVYGPGDNPNNVLSYAARQLKAKEPAFFGSGIGLRDWIYIDDAVSGILAAITTGARGVQEYDIGSGELTSVRTMIEDLASLSGVTVSSLTFDPSRDRPDLEFALAARTFPSGWRPSTDKLSGLQQLLLSV